MPQNTSAVELLESGQQALVFFVRKGRYARTLKRNRNGTGFTSNLFK
jgi:hypothetical protein